MMKNRVKCLALVLVSCFLAFSSSAQMFASPVVEQSKQKSTSAKGDEWGKFYGSAQINKSTKANASSFTTMSKSNNQSENQSVLPKAPSKQKVDNPEDYLYRAVPQVDRPTLDGVKRGRTSIISIVDDEGKTPESDGYIYLFYSDFKVNRLMSGSTTCDVSFIILSTFDVRLNSLAVRLKWPHMDTPVTFIDINPNQQYKMTYTLLGDGCYSMDKIPNIVVNRCRIKGMSQEDCARRIRWIRKL